MSRGRIWKYIGIGLLTVILEWIFVAWVYAFFDGMAQSERIVLGTGYLHGCNSQQDRKRKKQVGPFTIAAPQNEI